MIHDLKPYPAYKDSGVPWLGELPEHWEIQKLKHLTHFYNGLAFKPSDWKDTGVPIIRIQNLNGSEEFNYTTRQDLPKFLLIHPGDLLFSWSGNRGTSFGPFIWRRQFEGYLNQHIFKLDGYKLDIHYFAHLLRAVTKHIEDQTHGIIGLVHITKPELGAVCVPVAPPAEQSAIVRYLDHIDKRIRRYIRTKQKLIKLLEEQKQAIIHQAVTRGLDPNVKFKPSGVEWLGDVPEHWEVKKLKFEVTFTGGGTPSKANAEYWIGNIPWVSPKDMKTSVINDTEDHISASAVTESSTKLIDPGAVLVVVRSGILRHKIPVAINKVSVALNQDMKALQSKGRLHGDYIYALIEGCQKILITEWTKHGATVESIEHELMANSFVPIPPEAEQSAIVSFLEGVEKELGVVIFKAQHEISLLREYRTRLIADLVTGKLDVRKVVANLPDETEELDTHNLSEDFCDSVTLEKELLEDEISEY